MVIGGDRSLCMIVQLLLYVSIDGVGDGGNINDGICCSGDNVVCCD